MYKHKCEIGIIKFLHYFKQIFLFFKYFYIYYNYFVVINDVYCVYSIDTCSTVKTQKYKIRIPGAIKQ